MTGKKAHGMTESKAPDVTGDARRDKRQGAGYDNVP